MNNTSGKCATTPIYTQLTTNPINTIDMETKSEVLKKVDQLLRVRYNGDTPKNYLSHIKQFINFCDKPPLRLNNEDILNYNLHILDTSNSNRNVAINAIKAFFQLYLRKTVKEFSSIRPAPQRKVPKYISRELFINRLSKVENSKHRLIFILGYNLGLRSNETRSIKMEDIDIDTGEILIHGKGSKQRYVSLCDNLINILISYVDEYNPLTYLIEGEKGKYSQSSLNNIMHKYFGDFTYHNLRHSFAKFVYNSTGDIKLTADSLGHSTSKTTERFYVHGSVNRDRFVSPQIY